MNEIITLYGQLVSFLASVVGVSGALVGLFIYSINKRSKLDEDKHRFIVEKRRFEKNNFESLKERKLHPNEETASIIILESIYSDAKKSAALSKDEPITYDFIYKLILLNREIKAGSLQKNLALSFCVIAISITVLAVFSYTPSKARKPDEAKSAAHVSRVVTDQPWNSLFCGATTLPAKNSATQAP